MTTAAITNPGVYIIPACTLIAACWAIAGWAVSRRRTGQR